MTYTGEAQFGPGVGARPGGGGGGGFGGGGGSLVAVVVAVLLLSLLVQTMGRESDNL